MLCVLFQYLSSLRGESEMTLCEEMFSAGGLYCAEYSSLWGGARVVQDHIHREATSAG